jgi:choline kinase
VRGVILAAGKGARLNGTTGNKPKCLLRVGGRTLIERQIDVLRSFGIDDIVLVIGCRADLVRRACGHGVTYIENTRFAQTNSLYSLWLARPLLAGGFVVMNCDVLFHPQMLSDLLTARHENALLISYDDGPLGDEEMKIRTRCGRVVEISKQLEATSADGENVGVAKFGAAGARVLIEILDRRVAAGGLRDWAPRAFGDFALTHPLYAVGTRGLPWTEIDFSEDYERAVNEVLPAIEADRSGRAADDAAVHTRNERASSDRHSADRRHMDRRRTGQTGAGLRLAAGE